MTTTTTPAPSAAPAAAAPASPAAPVTPAPVAAATEPQTLNDYAELARQSLMGELPASPATEPQATGQEPSPSAAAPEPAEPSPEPTAEADELSADDVANWTEGEKKLHGALVKERAERKEARKQLREMEQKLADLTAKLTTNAPKAEPTGPAAEPSNAPSAPDGLADCKTFEEVDRRVVSAAATESQAVRLQQMLNRNGAEVVAEKLKASGVTSIGNTPIDQASADEIGDFLAAVYEGSRMTQAQANVRKDWIVKNNQSVEQATQIIPELNDKASPAYQFALQTAMANPSLLRNPNWPVTVAEMWLGRQAFNAKTGKPAAPVAPKAAPKPSAPGAPRTSVAALPQASARDAVAAKIANGTATMQEVQAYALTGIK